MSKKLFAVLVLFAVVGAAVASVADADADADVETDIPTTKPRAGKPLKPVRSASHSFGRQKVITVPKGDPRARPPVASATPAATATSASAPRVLKAVAPASAGACLANYNGAAVAAKGTQYQTAYKARGTKYSQPNRQFGINAKFADCSSFVTSILADTGFNCLFAAGRYTAYMNEQIRARGGYKQTAKVGDLVMWGSHTGLIVKQCTATTWSMVAMGNSGAGRAECKTVDGLKGWGSGGWLGFWTPRQ